MDAHTCYHGLLEIRYSPLDRFGVFAISDFKCGDLLHEAPVLVLEKGWETVPSVINHYLFSWPREGEGRAIGFGVASLLNHSANANTAWSTHELREVLQFFALRDIRAGEEILIDYGEDYWPNHDKYPARYSGTTQPMIDRNKVLIWEEQP